jgi:hypothetical protein
MRSVGPLILVSIMFGQQKQPTKPFKPPDFALVNPLIARDEGCVRDLAKAVRMDGLEQRKYLADLFVFGCVQRLSGSFRANILDFRKYGDGQGAVPVRKVYLINSVTAEEKGGWVIAGELISPQIIDAVIKSLPRADKKK